MQVDPNVSRLHYLLDAAGPRVPLGASAPDEVHRPVAQHHAERVRGILADGGQVAGADPGPRARRDALSEQDRRDADVARRLEGVMLSQVMARMREASGTSLFGSAPGAQIYEGMFDTMLGDALAAGRGVGLYREVEASLHRQRDAAAPEIG